MKHTSLRLACSVIALSLTMFLFQNCDKTDEPVPGLDTSTMMDIDSNVYRTVKIGNQWWMAENLKVTRFRNGTPISEIQPDEDWNNTAQPAWCNYSNTPNDVGLLYNFYVVTDSNNVAPAGWHVPTDDEWKQLEMHLGMTSAETDKVNWRGTNEGDELKTAGPQGWTQFENVWGNNESGFTALAGSCRMFTGAWGEPGLFANGFWWTSTSHNNDEAWYRHLDYKNSNVFRYNGPQRYGFSIRCVKDTP